MLESTLIVQVTIGCLVIITLGLFGGAAIYAHKSPYAPQHPTAAKVCLGIAGLVIVIIIILSNYS